MENIEDIKRALGASGMIYDAVRASIREGVSEREIYDLVGKKAGELLRDQQWEYIGDFVSGERTAEIGGDATDRKMKPGDLLILDLSLRCGGGWCDTCRTFFLGEPGEEIRRGYDTVLRCQQVGELTVRPGVRASDIKRVMEAFMVSQGYGGHMPHHGGHKVGNAPYEKPAFEETCDMLLEPGEVVTLEPGLYFENRFGMRVENNYLVTENGLINLFDYPREIDYFIVMGEGRKQ